MMRGLVGVPISIGVNWQVSSMVRGPSMLGRSGVPVIIGVNWQGEQTFQKQTAQTHSNDCWVEHLSCRWEMVSLESALTWLVITTRPSSSM